MNRDQEVKRTVEAIEQAKVAIAADRPERADQPAVVASVPEIERTEVAKHEQGEVVKTKTYTKADFVIRLGERQLHELGSVTIARYVAKVVDAESPVHLDEVVHRITELAGLKRAGSRIQKAVSNAIGYASRKGEILKKKNFLWSPNQDEVVVRDRSELESSSRKYEYVPQEELLETIRQIVESSYSVTKDILVAESFKVLGFHRVTGKAQAVFDNALRQGLREELFSEQDNLIVSQ